MSPRKIIKPTSVHTTEGVGYSHVAQVEPGAKLFYIAGQIALDKEGVLVGQSNIEAQTRQVYANISAILLELGGSMNDVVKFTTYLTDRASLAGFRAVRDELVPKPYPPNTLLFVTGLANQSYLVEIEAIAAIA